LWASGTLRCILVTQRRLAVQVFTNHHAFVTELCADADDAALIAERLWAELVDNADSPFYEAAPTSRRCARGQKATLRKIS
jgi:hypothetical protein